MKITFRDEKFIALDAFEFRKILKEIKFRWDAYKGVWFTLNPLVASRLRDFADETALKELNKHLINVSPWHGMPPHPDDLEPKKFQQSGARFILKRNRSYIAADPGLGKTIMAALAINGMAETNDVAVLYISPSFLTYNVMEELEKWKMHNLVLQRIENGNDFFFGDVVVVSDSLISNPLILKEIDRWAWIARNEGKQTLLIVDEAHRFKEEGSSRTQALLGSESNRGATESCIYGIVDAFEKVTYMSGTPMPNRPIELYPILRKSAPETINFMQKEEYGQKYCGARFNGYGFEYKGSTHFDELAAKVKEKFLLRLKKSLLKLPPVTEEILFVGQNPGAKITAFENKYLKEHSIEDLMDVFLKQKHKLEDGIEMHLTTYLRLLGLEKAAPTAEVVQDLMDNTGESVIVFGRYTETLETFCNKVSKHNPLLITGKVKDQERHKIKNKFQTDKGSRIIVGNMDAMGIGYTLTKATRVFLLEPSWVPGVNRQCIDRAHRFGQSKEVFAQYVCYKNSIDRKLIESNLRKMNTIDKL